MPKRHKADIRRPVNYYLVPSIPLKFDHVPSKTTKLQATELFKKISRAECFKNSKLPQKLKVIELILHAAKWAMLKNGTIRYSRRNSQPNYRIIMQVVAAMVEVGLLKETRSARMSNMESRLTPLQIAAAKLQVTLQ